MEEVKNTPENVPYIVYESTQARNERHIKRLVAALIIAIIMIFASNFMWLAYINQYDFESYSYEYQQDGRGLNIIGNGNGVNTNGTEIESYPEIENKEEP